MDQSILIRYLSGEASAEEIRWLKDWVQADEQNRNELLQMRQIWILSGSGSGNQVPFLHEDLLSVMDQIAPERRARFKRLSIWFWRAAAILAVPLAVMATLHFTGQTEQHKETAFNQINVPNRQRSMVTLSDGSRVQLNSSSQLRYPTSFDGPIREVYLEGEAYFEIQKDQERPFIVHTGDLEVKVTGTEFNVSAYPEDQTVTTTLISGAVQVSASPGHVKKEPIKLEPSDQLVYQKSNQTTQMRKVDTRIVTSWTSGEFIFRNQELGTILKTIERWYDIEIVVSEPDLLEQRLSGRFRDDEPLRQVMEVIRMTTPVQYEIREESVVLRREKE